MDKVGFSQPLANFYPPHGMAVEISPAFGQLLKMIKLDSHHKKFRTRYRNERSALPQITGLTNQLTGRGISRESNSVAPSLITLGQEKEKERAEEVNTKRLATQTTLSCRAILTRTRPSVCVFAKATLTVADRKARGEW